MGRYLFVLTFAALSLSAQSTTGTLTGTVRDTSGVLLLARKFASPMSARALRSPRSRTT